MSMTSTTALPDTPLPLSPPAIAQDQSTETFKDITYGSVRFSTHQPLLD